MSKNTNKIDGWIIIDKPLGMGSTPVVGRLKHILHPSKIGHAGTLDPLATGVLPIALGNATKLIPFVMDGRKIYDFQVTWGSETETDDGEGAVTATSSSRPTEADVRAVLPVFLGVIEQVPPAYSALKIGGQRAYDLARRGADVDLKARAVEIEALHLLRFGVDSANFRVVCGKGTYVRALGRDIGRKLGCLGHITGLRRMACGPFQIEDAVSIEQVEAEPRVLPIGTALAQMKQVDCSDIEKKRLQQGQRLSLSAFSGRLPNVMSEDVVCLVHDGQPFGLARLSQGTLHPYRMFS